MLEFEQITPTVNYMVKDKMVTINIDLIENAEKIKKETDLKNQRQRLRAAREARNSYTFVVLLECPIMY